jgi:uncharacterized damage-inducible protein DinB
MTEIERIRDQFRRAVWGDAWHGPALLEALAGVSAATAAARPIAGAHTIWELVHHADAWQRIPARRLAGERWREMTEAEDFPPVGETGEAAWKAALAALEDGARRFDDHLARFPAERLEEPIPGSERTFYAMLHGVVAHHLYHAGQIVLLRKAAAAGGSP